MPVQPLADHAHALPPFILQERTADADAIIARTRRLAETMLTPIVGEIDRGLYPEAFNREVGAVGGYGLHRAGERGLGATIESMAAISETCMSSGFMNWCQNTLVWYIINSENLALQAKYLDRAVSGQLLGGTGLSNPMKTIFGIETFKLKGRKVEGGYLVKGALPWVSNLGPAHVFGAIFEVEDGEPVFCLIDCANPAVTLKPCEPFLAMDGTGTYAVQVRDLFIGEAEIVADPAMPYVKKIRAGFILLQAGMALGVARDCIRMMQEVRPSLGHVNKFLDVQPEDLADKLEALEAEVFTLAATPDDASGAFWRRVVEMRLAGGEAAVAAAHHAMLHCGARGYVAAHRCQRRLREAYFVAIVTPATKQLRKMLAEMN
jgi:hypothetical protein